MGAGPGRRLERRVVQEGDPGPPEQELERGARLSRHVLQPEGSKDQTIPTVSELPQPIPSRSGADSRRGGQPPHC